jgi:DNA-binding transcriptional LysR family regulator
MNSLRGVMSFVASVEHGSFVAAARAMDISAVAVSRNVARLETQLGVRLFARTTRSMALTSDGAAFLSRCRAPLAALEQAITHTQDDAAGLSGLVRITALSPLARDYIAPMMVRFREQYPQVVIELQASEVVSHLIAEKVDIGIRAGPQADAGFISRPLGALQFALCASPAYLKRRSVPNTAVQLAEHDAIAFKREGDPPPTGLTLRFQPGAPPVPARIGLMSNDLGVVLAATIAGYGIARLPLPVALPALKRGALKVVLPETNVTVKAFLHFPSRRDLPQRVRVVVDFLLAELADHADFQTDLAPFIADARKL